MQTTRTIDFSCPACGTQSRAAITAIVDVDHNPEAKGLLLSGQLNAVQCPNCNTRSAAASPLLYHDANKELLITFIPMQVNMSEAESDKLIGGLMREVTDAMDSKMVKGYIFQPKRALTMQGLIEQVLEGDGVTKDMMDAQKERSRLVQLFLQTDPTTYAALIEEHDAKLDMGFFQTMSLVAQQYMDEGRADMADHVLTVQQKIAELSTVGKDLIQQSMAQEQMIQNVAQELQALGNRPTPADVVALVRPYAEDNERLQAFVGLARPLFDYAFFQELTTEIGKAPENERPTLEALRSALTELTQMVDEQGKMQMQAAANVLRQILTSPDPAAAIQANLQFIDDTFMAVLDMNIQEAERQQDIAASARLKSIRDVVMQALQASMNPEVRFINDLLSQETEADARRMIQARAGEFGAGILEVFDTLNEVMMAQGQPKIAERIRLLRDATEDALKA